MSAFRYHADLTNCILYTTAPPCHKCAQMIVQSGIMTVVYGKKQREVESQGRVDGVGGEGGEDSDEGGGEDSEEGGGEESEEGGGEGGQDSEEEREESDEEDESFSEEVSAEEIFYWAKVATL